MKKKISLFVVGHPIFLMCLQSTYPYPPKFHTYLTFKAAHHYYYLWSEQ